ncbi:MAG: type II toxin-antitoxin system MqsA family antitoxin [Desulfuromonadales bacterium]|nr:type II toxin-antitoxin system MqsA family antitoxin [Desulfuromonadales bacterium]
MSKERNGTTCPVCFQGTLKHGKKRSSFEYRGRTLEYEQIGAWCNHCNEVILTGKEAGITEPLFDEFIAKIDKEEADELTRIRKKLKLTQKQAAQITGGGHNAFSRYERGEVKPLPAVIKLLKLLDKHPELLKEVMAA